MKGFAAEFLSIMHTVTQGLNYANKLMFEVARGGCDYNMETTKGNLYNTDPHDRARSEDVPSTGRA